MRRPINWLVFSLAILFLFANLMLTGCGGGGGDDSGGGIESPAVSAMLRKVRSAAELEHSLKASLQDVLPANLPPGGGVRPAASDTNYSNTYTSEAGVDEFDYARYEGDYLYVAPRLGASTQVARELRILRTVPQNGFAAQVSSIPVEGERQVLGIYVANGRLAMLTSAANYLPPYEDLFRITLLAWEPTDLAIHVFDVSDPAHPARTLYAELDGVFVASRRVGDRVYLVTRYAASALFDPSARARLPGVALGELLPQVTTAGRTEPLVKPEDCYITNEPDAQGYPVLTTIISFSMQNPGKFVNTCYNEAADLVYASTSALYVSQPRLTAGGTPLTRVHKFAFTAAAPAYAGSAELPGTLRPENQGDFRMSEHQGMLRVVTAEQTSNPADWEDYRLFVLRPKPNELALEVLSRLPNDARPEELGKPNELLFAVRFAGERAYAVTFRQIDPLYVLDLANPEDPRIAGQLEIPGFSRFLHPVTQDLLLGLGNEAGHATLELFDVSQLEQPQSRGRIRLEGAHSDSEAMHDRHAFTYLPADSADRIAIPVTVTPLLEGGALGFPESALHQFEIIGKQSAASASLQPAGVVTPPGANDHGGLASSARSFIHGDTVFYVRDGRVWSTLWFAPSQVQGPF